MNHIYLFNLKTVAENKSEVKYVEVIKSLKFFFHYKSIHKFETEFKVSLKLL